MRDAAAERAAGANRIMGDVAHHGGEQSPERPSTTGVWKAAWRTQAPMHSLLALDGQSPQRLDPVDVDEMRRARETKRHDRHEALAAGEHAPVFGRDLGQRIDRLFDRLGCVIAKRRGLHRSPPRLRCIAKTGRTITARPYSEMIFWIDAQLIVYVKKCLHGVQYASDEAAALSAITIRKPSARRSGCSRSLENAKLLAGGQSLMPMLNMRFVLPDHIIDLNRVEGLSYIREHARRARDRRHDAPARPRILRCGARALADHARGAAAGRTPADPQPRHHRRLALPSRSGGGAGLARDRL